MRPSIDLRGRAQRRLEAELDGRSRPLSDEELRRPALVVAPHHDDETLGCGGTIARKAAAGTDVAVLFLTDGTASHGGIEPAELAETRRLEAAAAVRALGVDEYAVFSGDIVDGGLSDHLPEVTDLVRRTLAEVRPTQVFVPHAGDGHADHLAATTAGIEAAASLGPDIEVLEYPVWHWQQWPWVGLASPTSRSGWRAGELHGDAWRRTVANRFGLRFPATLDRVVDIAGTLPQKRAALEAYTSQVDRLGGPDWPVLADVSFGHFLDRLLGPCEFFRVTRPARAG